MFRRAAVALITSRFFRAAVDYFFKRRWRSLSRLEDRKKKRRRPRLVWGTIPVLNIKYWSGAMREAGYESKVIVRLFYSNINKQSDFDLYFNEIIESCYRKVPKIFKYSFSEYFVFDYILRNADIVHTSCRPMTNVLDKEAELALMRDLGIKSVIIPYGDDIYQYSKMLNITRRHTVQINYPDAARKEKEIAKNVDACVRFADIFIPCEVVDGIGRWDLLPCNLVTLDLNLITERKRYSDADGKNGTVTVVHAPNHRGAKGTDRIVSAIAELQNEGLKVELRLIEGAKNDELLAIMRNEADIAVNEVIGTFYALFCIEAMACGLPVISNLSVEEYTRLFRRFSYLDECPVVSASMETVTDVLRVLVTNPSLRRELGISGRQFVDKYHSQKTAQYVFTKIYDRIWHEKSDVDLMNMFNPWRPESYNNSIPRIQHPLKESKLQ